MLAAWLTLLADKCQDGNSKILQDIFVFGIRRKIDLYTENFDEKFGCCVKSRLHGNSGSKQKKSVLLEQT